MRGLEEHVAGCALRLQRRVEESGEGDEEQPIESRAAAAAAA